MSTKKNKTQYQILREELERISVTVETLQLWSEQMLATGAIDPEAYRTQRDKR